MSQIKCITIKQVEWIIINDMRIDYDRKFQFFCCYTFINIMKQIITLMLLAIVLSEDYHEFRLQKNQLALPFFNLCNQYQLMLDTGSEEVWLADTTCLNCRKKLNICPEIKQSKQQINYFKGSVRGDFIQLKTCVGMTRVFCAKQSYSFQNLKCNGIWGIKHNSTGKILLKKYMLSMKIIQLSLSFILLDQEQKLILGKVPEKYKLGNHQIESHQWAFNISGFTYDNHTEILDGLVGHFDSGSNMLVVPEGLYKLLKSYIKRQVETFGCHEDNQEKISFLCSNSIDLPQRIEFALKNNQGKMYEIEVSLMNLLQINQQFHSFQIEKTKQNKVIFGFNTFQGYIVTFNLDGGLRLQASSYEDMVQQQKNNFIICMLEYVVAVGCFSFIAYKLQHLINININKKIVI